MKHLLMPFFLCLLLILIGCQGGTTNQQDPGERDDDYETGVGSLDVSFGHNSPPSEMPQEQTHTISLQLKNVGSSPISNGFVSISYDRAVFEFKDRSTEHFAIQGKSVAFPEGETKILNFPFYALPLATEGQNREATLVANSCFDYRTKVTETVCIDMDPYDLKPDTEEQVCERADLSPGGTGGPVRVQLIETQMLIEDGYITPKFRIEIGQSSYGTDKIFAPGKGNAFCSNQQFDKEWMNQLEYTVTLSDIELTCSRDTLKLHEGRASFSCSGHALEQTQGNYEAPLFIELRYGVSKVETKKVSIVR